VNAKRIEASVRAADLVARLGGDEFAVLCRRCGRDEAGELSKRILQALRQPVVIEGLELIVPARIGVAWGERATAELLSRADEALYEAKRAGRDTLRFSDGS